MLHTTGVGWFSGVELCAAGDFACREWVWMYVIGAVLFTMV